MGDNGKIIIPLKAPQVNDGEAYKLMTWDGAVTPLIEVIR